MRNGAEGGRKGKLTCLSRETGITRVTCRSLDAEKRSGWLEKQHIKAKSGGISPKARFVVGAKVDAKVATRRR